MPDESLLGRGARLQCHLKAEGGRQAVLVNTLEKITHLLTQDGLPYGRALPPSFRHTTARRSWVDKSQWLRPAQLQRTVE